MSVEWFVDCLTRESTQRVPRFVAGRCVGFGPRLDDHKPEPPAVDPSDQPEVFCANEGCGRRIDPSNPVDSWAWLRRRWCVDCIDRLLDAHLERF